MLGGRTNFDKRQILFFQNSGLFNSFLLKIFSNGALPYDWLSNKQVSEQVPNGERLSKPEKCDVRLWNIVELCWQIDPQKRPTFLDLCQKLQTLLPQLSV